MKKRKSLKVALKKTIGWLHLWLGLLSGIVVCISMIGAAVFVWEKELTHVVYGDIVFAKKSEHNPLLVSQLFLRVKEAYPDKEFTFLQIHRDSRQNYAFRSIKRSKTPGWTWASSYEHYLVVYVNPYTGKVVGHIDKTRDWITMSRFLHQYLLLNRKIGSEIVAIAALIMVILAFSGLYLWWPKNRKALIQRLNIKWRARFKRVNWDFHSVGGFYTYLFLLFFAATGLTWSYSWWNDSVYRMLGHNPDELFVRPESPEFAGKVPMDIIDHTLADAIDRRLDWTRISFRLPSSQRKKGTISVRLNFNHPRSGWDTNDYFYYHPQTGALHHSLTHEQKLLGEKWRFSNYAMHVGSIYGWPTKVIASICALFFATLPISGFLIWWGRRRKKKRKNAAPKRKRYYA